MSYKQSVNSFLSVTDQSHDQMEVESCMVQQTDYSDEKAWLNVQNGRLYADKDFQTLLFYTDGSMRRRALGCGVFAGDAVLLSIPLPFEELGLENNSGQAEVFAILCAFAIAYLEGAKVIEIRTDYEPTMKVLQRLWNDFKSKLPADFDTIELTRKVGKKRKLYAYAETYKQIIHYMQFITPHFKYVPRGKGKGNIIADDLAANATVNFNDIDNKEELINLIRSRIWIFGQPSNQVDKPKTPAQVVPTKRPKVKAKRRHNTTKTAHLVPHGHVGSITLCN